LPADFNRFNNVCWSSHRARADVTGSIQGEVHDRSGAVVSVAKIVAINIQTDFRKEAVSAADGSFHILALPVGIYKPTVNSTGFRVAHNWSSCAHLISVGLIPSFAKRCALNRFTLKRTTTSR
jgi:hypothetical protein